MNSDPKILTAREAADRLGVRLDWLYQLVKQRKIEATKDAETGHLTIPTSAVDARLRLMEAKRELEAVKG